MPLNHDPNREGWEAEYWDDFIHDFGLAAYIEERYQRGGENMSFDNEASNRDNDRVLDNDWLLYEQPLSPVRGIILGASLGTLIWFIIYAIIRLVV